MSEQSSLTTISGSKYDIYSKLLDLCAASEYVTSREDFENVDFLKSGLFGYVTEALAMIMRDSSYHKTAVYRENYLNTAIMPKSIHNYAKMFNVDIIDARPSLRYATISIDTNIIDQIIQNTSGSIASYKDKYGVEESGNFMILDKINPIVAGEYYFSLEHSIEIYKNPKGKYIVKYCLNEKDISTSFGSYSRGGIINTVNMTTTDGKYLVFKVIVAQYKTVESSKIITGSTFIDTKVHNFSYSGQLCGMSLKYTKGTDSENVNLKFSNIVLSQDTASEKKVAYYSISDNNTIEISFVTNTVAGLPQTGGTLILKTYITEGFGGNISFNGDAVFLIKQDDFKSLPINVELGQDIISSGTDQTSLGNLKNIIIDKMSMRDTIITENDLSTWFATQSKLLEDVSNSGITFRKEKDNILRRTFSAFLLLRDGVSLDNYMQTNGEENTAIATSSYISSLVPTNTIDIKWSGTTPDFVEVSPTKNITYNAPTQTFIYGGSDNTDYSYRTPFNIVIRPEFNQVSYYYLETDDSSELEFSSVTNMRNISLIPTQLTITHSNPYTDSEVDNYELTFNIASDEILTNKIFSKLFLYINNTKIDLLTNSEKIYSFESNDTESEDSDEESALHNYKLVIHGGYEGIASSTNSSQIILNFFNSLNYNVPESASISLEFAFDDNTFDGKISALDEITFFSNLDDVINSDIKISTTETTSDSSTVTVYHYTLKDVPVVAKYWILSNINKKWFIRQLFVFINMLKANIDKLETTTFFNIKFRNTFGLSQYFTSTTTQLRLNLAIYIDQDKLNSAELNLTTTSDKKTSIENEIRDFIRVSVDNANADGELVISKVIMQTQAAYYNFIKHIDFNGLNGTFNQYVRQINTDDISYPLEYFSLDNTLETVGDGSSATTVSRLEKDIVFIYE